ncbi:hypothetical protein Ga0100231_001085 [Opitutaceae bacterium TAV4]|nr:hypothetical protein Ga0100231_001085 [Opitutaceae bacterium TAV4]
MSIRFKITNDVFPSADELRPIPAFRGENPRNGDCVEVNASHIMRNGRPCLPVMGEFHYSRYPREEWELEILKIKAGGIRILATYIFWNHHEEKRGVFNWSGQRDLRAFIGLCKKHGLEVALRIGPFAHGEARNGGLPDWLYAQPFEARSNDPRYLALVERLFGEIGRQTSGFMFGDGGPVVAIQLENEFMDSAAPWGNHACRGGGVHASWERRRRAFAQVARVSASGGIGCADPHGHWLGLVAGVGGGIYSGVRRLRVSSVD